MAIIRVENAKLSMGSKVLFDNISFSINEGDRVGLVGNNGCGKSSLVKCLVGEYEFDKGLFTKKKGSVIGYVSQEIPENIENISCHDFLLESLPVHDRESDFWKVDVALNDLGLRPDLWHKPVKALSGGWRRLLLIASATLKEPDLLILDEPTNHLDLGKIFKLEKWLKDEISIPYLMISHDREFLDRCTTKTLFMRGDGVHDFSAPFTVARENLLQADALSMKSHEKDEAEIKRLERASKRLKEWAKRSPQSGLARKGQAMQTRADKVKAEQTAVYKEKKRDIKLHHAEISSNALAVVSNTDICTPDGRKLFHIDRFVVKPSDRICILGLNGTGKSMFIQKLIEEYRDYTPGAGHEQKFWYSPQLKMGYLDQHLESLPSNKDAFTFISETFALNRTATTRELVNIGVPLDQQNMKIGDMSQGEKARLSLLVLKLLKPNFYVLDEPTNHLDINGQETLEDELDQQGHSCIFVSHDRRLVRSAATRYLEIKNGKLLEVESPDSFFDMLQKSDIDDPEMLGNDNDKGRSIEGTQKKIGPDFIMK